MIKQVVTTLKMLPVVEAVSIPFFPQFFVDGGDFRPNDVLTEAAVDMLREIEGAALAFASREREGDR
jgi:hypothetical protein